MEIISILLKAKMNHKDTIGYSTVIEEGSVQIMSAGSGLKPEEYNIGEEKVDFLQRWIYPKQQNINPGDQTRSFPKEKRKNRLAAMVYYEEGIEHCWINQNAKLSLGYFDKDKAVQYHLRKENMCMFAFNISGATAVNRTKIPKRDAPDIWDKDSINIACKEKSEILVIETVINQK
ncbi:MAG: pirin family protein [Agriterribacter sp.]